jgi:hypothetical protein
MTLLLLKTTGNKTSHIVLNITIRTSLNLIDSLTSDRTNMVQDPMCQSAQVQQSPQPSRVVILDEE